MDNDIQQHINDLYSNDDQRSLSQVFKDEFLKEETADEFQSSGPKVTDNQESSLPQASPNPPQKTDDSRPLYDQPEFNQADLIKDESDLAIKRVNKKIDDLYGGDNQIAEHKLSPAQIPAIATEEKKDALNDKIKQIDIGRQEQELRSEAFSLGLGYINLKGLPIVPDALKLISEETSRKLGIICFLYKERVEARVALLKESIGNPQIDDLLRELAEDYHHLAIKKYLTSKVSMDSALKLYVSLPKIERQIDDVEILESDIRQASHNIKDIKQIKDKIYSTSATELLSLIISTAVMMDSSDIHIEAEENDIGLRYRIDGVLHNVAKIEKKEWDKLISRIKLDSKLKINVKDRPQDGNFNVHIDGHEVDFRVSTLPTAYGESVVMRILYHAKIKNFTLDKLGIEQYTEDIITREIARPNGMIILSGPTGSGKTTTLYAILNKLNNENNKIITIEDPVEYKIQGINQSAVDAGRGYTFAKGLRSIVRQDPDIILVGEIRDKETADIALNAALTGHLVFSTLHANNAVGVISRFLALEAKPYLLAPALNVSIAQRLVRRICPKCKQQVEPTQQQKDIIEKELECLPEAIKQLYHFDFIRPTFYRGAGCNECSGIGYKGQIGIFEILEINDDIRQMIIKGDISAIGILDMARAKGMVNILQDGLIRALQGITSLDEVLRVV